MGSSFMEISSVIKDFFLILLAGTVAGVVCRRWGISQLVGYLVIGAVVGRGGLGLIEDPGHELELIAEAGALLLLFSVGIEFSFDELARLGRPFFIGGATQMALVSVPLGLASWLVGVSPAAAVLAGAAGAFSSTVLVFRALTEEGQLVSRHGRSGIAVLLFQDAALVPLLLLVPLMTGGGETPSAADYLLLIVKTAVFLLGVIALHWLFRRYVVRLLIALRSVELVTLMTVSLLCGLCWAAHATGLPPAIGAFATGLVLSGTRISRQVDAIILPFRETFAAVFFVTLGMLLKPIAALAEPLLLLGGLVGVIGLKTFGGAAALRLSGLPWRRALGMGLGLSQLGEFSFLLISRGVAGGIVTEAHYNRILFIAVVSLILTPLLLRRGLAIAGHETDTGHLPHEPPERETLSAVVVGIGPMGGQIASRLETMGVDLALVDLSPVNLHAYAQAGFNTFAGDARDLAMLKRAGAETRKLAVVCVPVDEIALDVVKSLREINRTATIIVRCRFQSFVTRLRRAGANIVVSEEMETAGPLLKRCEEWIDTGSFGNDAHG